MPFAKVSQDFFYKVSYKNPSPALPILLADFTKLFSSIADFGSIPKIALRKGCFRIFIIDKFILILLYSL
ncbi:MAG TPA: hypothetical protein HPP56_01945 [Nitrospirae bacterium]|nr:hypothetical protein [Nitrospirota bacterium]